MDFRIGAKAEQVRRDIRTFLAENFSEADRKEAAADGGGHNWELYRKLAADGWVSAGWPEELGGGGRDPYEILTLYWELCKAGFPWIGLLNNGFIGHTLLAMGTEQQRTEIVPKIAEGEIAFALGYTEPGSGSDVAGAATDRNPGRRRLGHRRPENVDDHGDTPRSTSSCSLAPAPRTARIADSTMFLVPTDAEGVDVQPIQTMGGERSNGVYLTKVRVPDSARVGEVDKAWAVVRFALGLEQAMGYADIQERFIQAAGRWALEVRARWPAALRRPP